MQVDGPQLTVEGFLLRTRAVPAKNATYRRQLGKKLRHVDISLDLDYTESDVDISRIISEEGEHLESVTHKRPNKRRKYARSLAQRLLTAAVTSGATDPCDEILPPDTNGRRPLQFFSYDPMSEDIVVLHKRRTEKCDRPTRHAARQSSSLHDNLSLESGRPYSFAEAGKISPQPISTTESLSLHARDRSTSALKSRVFKSSVETKPRIATTKSSTPPYTPPLQFTTLAEAEKMYRERQNRIK